LGTGTTLEKGEHGGRGHTMFLNWSRGVIGLLAAGVLLASLPVESVLEVMSDKGDQ
jgi:hypothetical protein